MSIRIMTMVFDRYHAGGGEMLLALSLADHAKDDGTDVYPSIKALAAKTRQSERTVQYQLRRMEECGWIVLVNSGNGGRNQRREYIINPGWLKGADIAPLEKGATDDIKGATQDTKGARESTKGCSPLHPHITINESSVTIIEPPQPKATILGFAEFWDAYPKKKSKGQAEKAFEKLNPDEQLMTKILSSIEQATKSRDWRKDDGQFIPYPASWLNAKGWEDELTKTTSARPKNGAMPNGNFANQDYRAGVAADGSF